MALPNGWTEIELEKVGQWGSGGTPTRSNIAFFEGGTIPWLVIGDLNDGIVTSSSTFITQAALENSSAKLIPANTLLVAMYGSIGKLGITGIECATNQAIAFCKPRQDVALLRYLFYALMYAKPKLIALGQGGAQQNISQGILRAFKIPLAPLNEQGRIADKLDEFFARLDVCRDRLNSIPSILKRFRQAVLASATSGELTKEWREARGIDLNWSKSNFGSTGSVTGGITKSSSKQANAPITKKYLRVANVYANRLLLDDVAEIGTSADEFARTKLQTGDLLIVEGNGSLEHIGRAALWRGEILDCAHQNHLIRWRSGGAVQPEFALLWLMSPEGRESLVRLASTTTGLHTLSLSKVSAVPLLVPSDDEQHEIIRRVEELFKLADKVEQQLTSAYERAALLTSATLSKAFMGELVHQDPNDEPASELLAHLRTERAETTVPKIKRTRRPRAFTEA